MTNTHLFTKEAMIGQITFGLKTMRVGFYDGDQYGSNVDNFTNRKLRGKVVDNILNAPVYFSRQLSMGEAMSGKTEDVTIDVVSDTQGQWITGLEDLNAAAVNSTITLSFAQTAFTQPQVSIMLESFANTGVTGIIPLDSFKYSKAAAQTLQALGSAIYGTSAGNQPSGLGIIVLDSGTIGGQSRSTYPVLNATNTSSGGTLTIPKMDTLFDAISSAGLSMEEPNAGLSTPSVWSFYGQLLAPALRENYNEAGFDKVPVRSQEAVRGKGNLVSGAGFTSISYRGIPILKDQFAPTGTLYLLNENKFGWYGRSIVPEEYADTLEKVDLGTNKAYEGTGAESLELPSEYNGFFYQKPLTLPYQAGRLGRFYVIGQEVSWEYRKEGQLNAITGV